MKYRDTNLRLGYTTGSCAAGASLAAALMLERGEEVYSVTLMTPANIELTLEVKDIVIGEHEVSCAIKKDSGDDPDTTDGIMIYAKVSKRNDGIINIDGGEGIGVITKKGLFGNIGDKAINPVPRSMIKQALESVDSCGYDCIIYAPEGEKIGKRTYNENLGIVGGISIIGTSGIVYPMSEDAIIKTIKLEVDVVYAEHGTDEILFVPGNYGERMKSQFGRDIPHVQMSNYVGEAIRYAYDKGFRKLTFLGHAGKFSKLSLGIFNTHSKNCDTRMEAFVYYLIKSGYDTSHIDVIESFASAEEAMNYCLDNGLEKVIEAMEKGAEQRIKKYLKDEELEVGVHIYSMERGIFGC